MKDTILYQRDMVGRDNNGHIVRATAKLYSLGTQDPYFSFTTGSGADHEKIREAFDDISHFVDLHLCGRDGAPMHTVANAIYHAENGNKESLANHLRINGFKAESIIGAFACIPSKVRAYAMTHDCDNFLIKARDEHKKMIRHCQGNDDIAARKERDNLGNTIEQIEAGGLPTYHKILIQQRRTRYMERIVDTLRDQWQSEAGDCIAWLKDEDSEDYVTDGALQWDDDSPAIQYDGETFNIDDSFSMDDGLHVTWNGAEYYLFADSEIAGIAAREYWEDMARNDQTEFTCIVGEAALIVWGLGEFYAVGSTSVGSLEDWLDLWLDTPEEYWASYDSKERECYINESLADEFDFDWNEDGEKWQLAVFYRW